MKTTLNRIFSLLLVLTVPVFLVACEGDDRGIEDEGEFGTGAEGYGVPPSESAPTGSGTFTTWDSDSDGVLTADEFGSGLNQGVWWTQWDTDGDGSLNQQEFDAAVSDREWHEDGLFSEWDADGDGELSEDEWEAGLFDTWDENSDNRIGEEEYDSGLFG